MESQTQKFKELADWNKEKLHGEAASLWQQSKSEKVLLKSFSHYFQNQQISKGQEKSKSLK